MSEGSLSEQQPLIDLTKDPWQKLAAEDKKSQLDPKAVFTALQDPETFATTLLTICLIMYGDETFQIEDPIVLFKFLEEDFHTELHENCENRLQAILIALKTDYFWNDLEVFKSICQTLFGGDPGVFGDFVYQDDITVPEILWGMYEVALVSDKNVVETVDYAPAIQLFIDTLLKTDVNDVDDQASNVNELGQRGIDPTDTVIADNVAKLKAQLLSIGLKDLPAFPIIEVGVGEDVNDT
jgi:hypothetical protein